MGMNATINLKQMVNKADKIAERGVNLEMKINNLIDTVKTMQPYWQGQSYVDFVSKVNKAIPTLTKMVNYFQTTLPKEIISKRNQYAKADQKSSVPNGYVKGNVDWNINISLINVKEQGDELIFNYAGMMSKADMLVQIFDSILKTNLPNIKDDFKSITWKGSTGDSLRSKFNANMDTTIDTIKKIRTAFRKYLDAQGKAMNDTELLNATTHEMVDLSILHRAADEASDREAEIASKSYDWTSEV